jgi:hypothetical protein
VGPLAVVEEQLGSVESWPTSVIMDMFHEELKVSVSRRVAAFMYGNGVSVSDAANLYKACQAAWRNVSETHMYGWYMQWDMCVLSNIFYYNTKKSVMWLRRDERLEPEVKVRNSGPARSRWPGMISLRIEELRMVWGEIRGNMS